MYGRAPATRTRSIRPARLPAGNRSRRPHRFVVINCVISHVFRFCCSGAPHEPAHTQEEHNVLGHRVDTCAHAHMHARCTRLTHYGMKGFPPSDWSVRCDALEILLIVLVMSSCSDEDSTVSSALAWHWSTHRPPKIHSRTNTDTYRPTHQDNTGQALQDEHVLACVLAQAAVTQQARSPAQPPQQRPLLCRTSCPWRCSRQRTPA